MEYKSEQGPVTRQDLKRSVPSAWRFIRLSHNRRYLHFADYDSRREYEPGLEALEEKGKPRPPWAVTFEARLRWASLLTCSSVCSRPKHRFLGRMQRPRALCAGRVRRV